MLTAAKKQKIAIIGAGAIGCTIGGLLVRAGYDVVFIDKEEKTEKLNSQGLSVTLGRSPKFHVNIRAQKELNFRPDIIFLAIKNQHLENACRMILPYARGATLAAVQNGVNSEKIIARIFNQQNIVSAVIHFNANLADANHVQQQPGAIILGSIFDNNNEKIKTVYGILSRVLPVTISKNILGARWSKLMINIAGNSINALTNKTLPECMRNPEIRKITGRILKEALAVAEKSGVKLQSLPGLPVLPFTILIKSPLPLLSLGLKITMGSAQRQDTVTSTLQSLRNGEATEIDYLNGEIVKRGKELGIATPYNSQVVNLIKQIEGENKFYSFADLVNSFSKIN